MFPDKKFLIGFPDGFQNYCKHQGNLLFFIVMLSKETRQGLHITGRRV